MSRALKPRPLPAAVGAVSPFPGGTVRETRLRAVTEARPEPPPARGRAMDGNEAVASVAYRGHEVIAIYPITPASPMGELADLWASEGRQNLWGDVPEVVEMQSEGGAAGAVHGALQAGALTTTFTASQGLLLMLPDFYKIAGELTPFVAHVAARAVASHALSIFCDHSDVMAARATGFALLASGTPQEAHDLALVAQAASLRSRVPFLHFFDGFRTSHEIARVEELSNDDLLALLDPGAIAAHRQRGLTPDRPVIRGTAQNPDVFFQGREAANRYYQACPGIVQEAMDRLAERTGRRYRVFDYHGHPRAERVIVLMGSGAETAHEVVDHRVARGERVGLLRVRLYRPFAAEAFAAALPPTVRALGVLDRTKEAGSMGEPLYLDVAATVARAEAMGIAAWAPSLAVVGGRYGLGSKELDPPCVDAVFEELSTGLGRARGPRHGFTVGIEDDVTGTSLPVDRSAEPSAGTTAETDSDAPFEAVLFGLGSDGTVGASKSTLKIVGEQTDLHVQGHFVYDSKKSGAITVSHLRFSRRPIRSTYQIRHAGLVACHQRELLERHDVLACARRGATFLLAAPGASDDPAGVWEELPRGVQEAILDKGLRFWVVDAHRIARDAGLGGRINTVMQACFFSLAGLLPVEDAVEHVQAAAEAAYGRKGSELVRRNRQAVERALGGLRQVEVPGEATSERRRPETVPPDAPAFVREVIGPLLAGQGDRLPVSAFPPDGTWPVGTSRWEKRNLAREIPVWDPDLCVQCNECAFVCPHAAIRAKAYDVVELSGAPEGFRSTAYRAPDLRGFAYTVQVAPEDCTGCGLCIDVCPAENLSRPGAKAIRLEAQRPRRDRERASWEFFLRLPDLDRTRLPRLRAKESQLLPPRFEFSGACAGCGETPYLRLLTQLFGDRLMIANATGCSSIYGGNLPTTPYTAGPDGRGPAWANSLFEDNAEFGLGLRLGVEAHARQARRLLASLASEVGDGLAAALLATPADGETAVAAQRDRVAELRRALAAVARPEARWLELLADYLVPKSVWLVGGDGWAYDIGYGGLDHVLASGRNVNVLVLDTEVYSNTGGQQSKATPLLAAVKFAAAGKETPKKDLGLEAMSQGRAYVARVSLGAQMNQVVRALCEAESYPGPSLILALSPCIEHGYDLALGCRQQRLAVASGAWPLFRYDPRRIEAGQPPLQLDSGPPKVPLLDYLRGERRFSVVEGRDPERFRRLVAEAERQVTQRLALYKQLAAVTLPQAEPAELAGAARP